MASKSEDYPLTPSPLHLAVSKNNYKLAENLIMRGANVNAMGQYSLWGRSNVNCSPLHIAVDLRNKMIIELLLKHKADINIQTSTGETALCIATKAAIDDYDEIIETLIEAGADVNLSSRSSSLPGSISSIRKRIADVLTCYNLIDKSKSFDGFCNMFIFITVSILFLSSTFLRQKLSQ